MAGINTNRRNGQHYAENIVDPVLLFDSGTWTIASGTGTASLDILNVYVGNSSLKVENNTPASDIVATNSVQSTVINVSDNYQLSCYVKKDIAEEIREGAILIYKNAVLLDTVDFSIGSTDADEDINDTWVRIQSDTEYPLTKSSEITFQFRLDGATTTEITTAMWFDGIMLNANTRQNVLVPAYVKPVINPSLETSTPVLGDLTVDSISLSALSTAPSSASDTGTLGQIRIDADYIYVCTATDTWKRVAIATW